MTQNSHLYIIISYKEKGSFFIYVEKFSFFVLQLMIICLKVALNCIGLTMYILYYKNFKSLMPHKETKKLDLGAEVQFSEQQKISNYAYAKKGHKF